MTYEEAIEQAIRHASWAERTSDASRELADATTSLAFTALAAEMRANRTAQIVREELH